MEVAFDEGVTLRGHPYIELDVGGVARRASARLMLGGVYGYTLNFDYVVREGDPDADGIGIGANRVNPNGGGIHDSAANAAGLSHGALAADPDHQGSTPALGSRAA